MPRTLHRLSPRTVTTLTRPGVYADGGGLYLRVKSETSRSWIYVWHDQGRRRETGLGSPPAIGLARARGRAQEVREIIADGGDPVLNRRARRQIPTFGAAADAYIEARKSTVRSAKSVARWKRMLGANGYAAGLRSLAVDRISMADVYATLKPHWDQRPNSAGLLRGYIETVLDIAQVNGHRSGDNPAAWSGRLEHLLPARQRLTRGHHAAMPFNQVPAFMAKLADLSSIASRALEFTILTAVRTSETLLARWTEIDLEQSVWTIPSERMKAGKEHRVPLAPATKAILRGLPKDGEYVFPGNRAGRPLSNMAMQMVLRRMEMEVTVHGFRSSFRDWAGEATETSREVAEAALAHSVGDGVELAYRRGDAFNKRAKLMIEWAGYILPGTIQHGD